MATAIDKKATKQPSRAATTIHRHHRSSYPYWFYAPAAVLFGVLFIVPTFASFFFSLTRWTLFDYHFIGLDNYRTFFSEPALVKSLQHTLIYAVVTSGVKVVLGMLLAVLLTSQIRGRTFLRSVVFFPVLVSTIGVGLTFTALMDPKGLINDALSLIGVTGPDWLGDPSLDLDRDIRVLIGGLRSFDLIWAMTGGGPGFTSDVIGSVIYKQYQAGFYGISTAGNVILFLLVTLIVVPLFWFLNRKEVEL
jgi:raffinose/stachyose/melibiose transport system permease protein